MNLSAILAPIFSRHGRRPDALLPILHALQDALGHVPDGAVPLIATALNLSRAEVHGVLSYYPHFRRTPPGRHVVRVCRAEACQAVGGEALAAHVAHAAHVARRPASADFTVEDTYCLGLCACGPAVQVDETSLHARMTPEKFDALMSELEARP